METKKVYNFIKGNLINLIVILTSFGYIFYDMLGFSKTGLTIYEVFAKLGMGVIVGFIIKQGLSENGFNIGYNSPTWQDEFSKYNEACNLANPNIEKLDNFYEYEKIETKVKYCRANLIAYRMRYDWFFDNQGNYVENPEMYNKLTKKQKIILKKCCNSKPYVLNLLSEYTNEVDSMMKREKTDKDQRRKMYSKNGLAQIVSSIIGAYFVVSWGGWNWGAVIVASIQVCIWIACGISQLYTNYNYVVVEKTDKLKEKKRLIIKFCKGCDNGLYKHSPYEEEK